MFVFGVAAPGGCQGLRREGATQASTRFVGRQSAASPPRKRPGKKNIVMENFSSEAQPRKTLAPGKKNAENNAPLSPLLQVLE